MGAFQSLFTLCVLIVAREVVASSAPRIRVKIKSELPEVVIRGTDMHRRLEASGDERRYGGKSAIRFLCRGGSGHRHPRMVASVVSPTGLLSLGKERYRGSLLVTTSEGGKGCDVIQRTSLPDYLEGLLAREMNASWPLAALKAQAVAARTYALHMATSKRGGAFYDLESSERHQVGGNFFDSTKRTARAVRETGGLVLVGPGRLVPAFFSRPVRGRTLLPGQVWSRHLAGYQEANCEGCRQRKGVGKRPWQASISWKRMEKFLAWSARKGRSRAPSRLPPTSRWKLAKDSLSKNFLRIYLGDRPLMLRKSLFRRYFGRTLISSNHFRVRFFRNGVKLRGRGKGHGVGMCQIGALELARKGARFSDILKSYYPRLELVKRY